MSPESSTPEDASSDEPWTLGRIVHKTRVALESLSPENKDSAAATVVAAADQADASFGSAIHTAYQAVKSVATDTPPFIVLGVTGVAVGVPSLRFGTRAFVRNTGLSLALAASLIYPDKIASRWQESK